MRKVIITATIAMTVFCTAPLVTPAQAFAEQKVSQVHVVEEQPSLSAEESLDYIEADAALATYNNGSLDTISKTSSLVGKGAAKKAGEEKTVPTHVKVWNKSSTDEATKQNSLKVRNLTVDQAVNLWMTDMKKTKTAKGSFYLLANGGRNYAIHLTEGTRADLEKAMKKALTLGFRDKSISGSANRAIRNALCKNNYRAASKERSKKNRKIIDDLYNQHGIIILRGASKDDFDYSYWVAKCAARCSKDMNLAQYADEPEERREKDISFAVMEWCRKRAFYGFDKNTFKALYNKNAITYCEPLANYVETISSVFGVHMGVVTGDNHAINILKTGGKYYYMDFQNDNTVCDADYEYGAPLSAERIQLYQELMKLNLPKTKDWTKLAEIINSASSELKTLADTVVAQMEAENPENGIYTDDSGNRMHWDDAYSSSLRYFIAKWGYVSTGELGIAYYMYRNDINTGKISIGEANWLTFKEKAGDPNMSYRDYKQTSYGRIYGNGYHTGKVLGFTDEDSLLASPQNSYCEGELKPTGSISNVGIKK